MNKVLIIDDDLDMCRLLERFLVRNHFEVRFAHTGKKGLEEVQNFAPDVILCDFRLEDTDGKDLLLQIKSISAEIPVIIITGYSDIKVAVEVIKHGAFDYVTKPLFPQEILITINKAINDGRAAAPQGSAPIAEADSIQKAAAVQPDASAKKVRKSVAGKYIFGDSKEFRHILKQMDLVSPTNYSVIIYGESGSGKEVIAQEIHARSKRKNAPFIAIDCGALSKELAGSELFGHEKGSFTGALNQKIGSLELANGGTVFLDEIANLPYDVQVSLLRVVQERKMRRIGGNKDIDLDIRIIVASNEKLWEATKKGKFREDLYHRFNEFSINVPPLRERRNDIMTFAHFFLEHTNGELDKHVEGFQPEVEHIFKTYSWPGNLRELKNVVKRSALLADGSYIDVTALPFELVNYNKLLFDEGVSHEMYQEPEQRFEERPVRAAASEYKAPLPAEEPLPHMVKSKPVEVNEHAYKTASIDAEYEMIVQALKKANYNKSKAAKLLNVDRKTLYNKMKQYNEFNEQ
ncbi:sigma-54-dependent transcriptional regulator [Sediminibacterium soli]|uniref:sigma-54-dependent transcriptional regulator n=1 Tax=Sediminibacterium soli TaxID=2698829 RepID=UPI00137A598A|nr:sigma-54 dependent transcriptional regulator [Sediminibacterium soli]NCI45888.1 sigma-54-dependent Fis family transcriptional regulator [Sediminibacterium soli]